MAHFDLQELSGRLHRIDGRGYKAYKQIAGPWHGDGWVLRIDHVQGDPFAEPSRVRAAFEPGSLPIPEWATGDAADRVAVADFLNRRLLATLDSRRGGRVGSGKGGVIELLRPGQQVLSRTSLVVTADGGLEVRLRVGLPARGRRVMGHAAAELVTEQLPALLGRGLTCDAAALEALRVHVETVRDSQSLRGQLADHGLVAFVADGALLPRCSGVDDRPLASDRAVALRAPDSLRVTLQAPHSGAVTGLGIPRGVTLIVGGGYHGKSTLLRAIERGVYDHIPGDGREQTVALASAVKIRAEDGRQVSGVDISAFIANLPGGDETRHFSTTNASGSTSQAAAIAEAIEVGAGVLLLDEDTSATNFMIRDARMQRLVAADDEPITPFIDRARALHDSAGISTVLVVGGAGDYFDIADTVIAMRAYEPYDVTADARRIAHELPTQRRPEAPAWCPPAPRRLEPSSIDASRGRRDVSIKAQREDRVLFGSEEVDLSAVEQIVERAQTRAMAQAVVWARDHAMGDNKNISSVVEFSMSYIENNGLEAVQGDARAPHGDFAAFRGLELAAFINRLRGLRVRPGQEAM